ncbi:MAG: hypothetical protein JSV66_06010, partial [Trueperaceae bacterium]
MSVSHLLAGFGRSNITPSLAVPHAGWGAQTHVLADGVHRELYVDVLLLEQKRADAEVACALVSFDLVGLYGLEPAIQAAVARETGLAADAVIVTVTHNHANPVVWENWIGSRPEQVAAYRASLPDAAAGAARAAKLSLRPVRAKSAFGRCTIGRNRRQRVLDRDGSQRIVVGRDDAGVSDPDVLVWRLDELDGTPYSAVLGYTCHPTTLGPDNRLHSPDYPGVAKAVFEAATGASCLFLQGAAGNVGPLHGFTGDVAVVERLGSVLGLEAARTYAEIDSRPVDLVYQHTRESGASLAIWEERPRPDVPAALRLTHGRVMLPLRPQPPIEEVDAHYRAMQAELARVMSDGSAAELVEATMFRARRAQMAQRRARLHGGLQSVELDIWALVFGELALALCNGEPFCEIGLAIKRASPFANTFFGGYTGASIGYIPWPEAYPQGGYAVETTPFLPEAA